MTTPGPLRIGNFPLRPHPVALPLNCNAFCRIDFGILATQTRSLGRAWRVRTCHRARLRAAKRESSLEHLRPSTKTHLEFCYMLPNHLS